MKRITLELIVTLLIILAIAAISFLFLYEGKGQTTEEITKCIGQKAVLYTRLGCPACKTQENLFGENYQYLNIVDCFFESDKCTEITNTPTWIIKGTKYIGVQSIKELQELTGC